MLPRIGLTTSLNPTADGVAEQRLDLRSVDAVARAGGLPVIVPILADDALTDAVAARLDGLIVSGGPAITVGLVGALPDDLSPTDPRRSHADARLLGSCLRDGRPVLGICYGMQLGSALLGGTIHADAERDLPGTLTHGAARGGTVHDAHVVPGTHLHRLVGAETLRVNTRHVQAIATPGDGLVVSATAPDGIVEAVETPDGAFVGVQFHPEAMTPPLDALFTDLVGRARAWRAAQGRGSASDPADR